MSDLKRVLLPVIALFALWASATARRAKYTNQWVTEIRGGEEVAQRVARDLGYTYKGQIAPFDDHYLLARSDQPQLLPRDSSHLTRTLEDLDEVKWAEQQLAVERSKRDLVPEYHERTAADLDWDTLLGSASKYSSTNTYSTATSVNENLDDPNKLGKGDFDSIPEKTVSTKPAKDSQLETYKGVTSHVKSLSRKSSVYEGVFNDPMWDLEWYLQDYRTKDMPVMDHNVVPVYRMGYAGKGVTIMVVDDGILHDHPDLVGNFDADLSYDFCNEVAGCRPDYGISSEGTMCAGIIGMVANNHKCGVGIAYKAKVAGAKVLCSRNTVSSLPESHGLVHELEKVDIYSNSWGSEDDGMTMEKIPRLTASAIDRGISQGRNRKGAIYVFSAGNGKHLQDNCGADGMANSIHTIVIASANQLGNATFFSERCSAIFATAYTGEPKSEAVVATTGSGGCTKGGSGTAMSVPIASGIIALALDAKSDLRYRDVMHLIVWSSEVAPLADNEDTWNKNGRGLWVSKDFGFGLLNAENMVNLVKSWKHVPEKVICKETIKVIPSQFYAVEGLKLFHDTQACQDQGGDGVRYLEHIELTATVEYPYRGAIEIYVKSPEGTKTTILDPRRKDRDPNGLKSWTIKSVHTWGENPKGRWIIGVKIVDNTKGPDFKASARDFTITFHGTHSKPNHYNQPRNYAAFRLPDGTTSHVTS